MLFICFVKLFIISTFIKNMTIQICNDKNIFTVLELCWIINFLLFQIFHLWSLEIQLFTFLLQNSYFFNHIPDNIPKFSVSMQFKFKYFFFVLQLIFKQRKIAKTCSNRSINVHNQQMFVVIGKLLGKFIKMENFKIEFFQIFFSNFSSKNSGNLCSIHFLLKKSIFKIQILL